jgi:hypothetical protein
MKGKYFPEINYMMELENQCEMTLRAIKALREGLIWWRTHDEADASPLSAPIELARNAQSLMAHATAGGRMLFVGGRKREWKRKAEPRCRRIRYLLDIRKCVAVEHIALRHDWEHLDERLDDLFDTWTGAPMTIESIRTMKPDAKNPTQVQRGIDPESETLYFYDTTFEIGGLEREIKRIKSKIDPAIAKLEAEKVSPLYKKQLAKATTP